MVFAETYGMYERILLLYNVTFTFVERFQFHFSSKSVPFMIIKSSIHVFTFFTYNSSNCILIQHFFWKSVWRRCHCTSSICSQFHWWVCICHQKDMRWDTGYKWCNLWQCHQRHERYLWKSRIYYVCLNQLICIQQKKRFNIFYFDISLPNIELGEKFKCSAWSNLLQVYNYTEVIYKRFHKFSRSCIISFVRF